MSGKKIKTNLELFHRLKETKQIKDQKVAWLLVEKIHKKILTIGRMNKYTI